MHVSVEAWIHNCNAKECKARELGVGLLELKLQAVVRIPC